MNAAIKNPALFWGGSLNCSPCVENVSIIETVGTLGWALGEACEEQTLHLGSIVEINLEVGTSTVLLVHCGGGGGGG